MSPEAILYRQIETFRNISPLAAKCNCNLKINNRHADAPNLEDSRFARCDLW